MMWLPDDDKSLIIHLAVSTEYRRVTDREIEGQTGASIVRAMHNITR